MSTLSTSLADALVSAGLGQSADEFQSIATNKVKHRDGATYFVKEGHNVKQMMGEAASLRALAKGAPGLVPNVYYCAEQDGSCIMISDHFELGGRGGKASQEVLGKRMAQELHDPNGNGVSPTGRYGFPIPTHCGDTEQDNTEEDDWLTFFRDRRLGDLFKRLEKRDKKLFEAGQDICQRVTPMLLTNFDPPAAPVILHGDFWTGNVSSKADGSPCIYDPSSAYGHGESDFGIARMFGGLGAVEEAYFSVRKRSQPHHEQRMRLYELYHHLNHAFLFGGGYTRGALSICRELSEWADEKEKRA